MCVAIVQKIGAVIDNRNLYEGWISNKDGGGFAYVDRNTNKVVIKSGFLEYNKFQKAYEAAVLEHGDQSPMLVHMRIRTSGDVSEKNCHPFRIRGGALIHNGIMFTPTGTLAGRASDKKSDTRIFCDVFHNALIPAHVRLAEKGILSAIGGHNKLCMLYDTREYIILNEGAGYWKDDVWYSNRSCEIYTRNHQTS